MSGETANTEPDWRTGLKIYYSNERCMAHTFVGTDPDHSVNITGEQLVHGIDTIRQFAKQNRSIMMLPNTFCTHPDVILEATGLTLLHLIRIMEHQAVHDIRCVILDSGTNCIGELKYNDYHKLHLMCILTRPWGDIVTHGCICDRPIIYYPCTFAFGDIERRAYMTPEFLRKTGIPYWNRTILSFYLQVYEMMMYIRGECSPDELYHAIRAYLTNDSNRNHLDTYMREQGGETLDCYSQLMQTFNEEYYITTESAWRSCIEDLSGMRTLFGSLIHCTYILNQELILERQVKYMEDIGRRMEEERGSP